MPIPLELFRVGVIKQCNVLNYFWLIAAINISNAAFFFPPIIPNSNNMTLGCVQAAFTDSHIGCTGSSDCCMSVCLSAGAPADRHCDRLNNLSTCCGTGFGDLWLPLSFLFLPLASKAQEQGWEAREETPIVGGVFQLDGEVKTEKKGGQWGSIASPKQEGCTASRWELI